MRSIAAFSLRTRWGQALDGRFPLELGIVRALPDGRWQVRMDLSASHARIIDHPGHTRQLRGEAFFDVGRHPRVRFESEAFSPTLVETGGELAGILEIRGVGRRETLTLMPASCGKPMVECPVRVTGTIHRGDYGMDRWGLALADRVGLELELYVLLDAEE